MATKRKVFSIITFIVLIGLAGFVYFKFYFVFGEGVKAGELNYLVNKGYVFKTYEGRLIQSGFKGQTGSVIQSNEFMFSVTNVRVAKQLMNSSGKIVEVHYKEYLGKLPWRGVSEFVVDSIIAIHTDNKIQENLNVIPPAVETIPL